MAQNLEDLARRGRMLGSIGGIVRTMKTLAAVNAAPYEQAATAIEAYHQTIRQGFAAFAYRMGAQALPPFPPARQRIVAAFGSDHGFCGNYNDLVAQAVQQLQASHDARRLVVLCIGARLQAALHERGLQAARVLTPPASAEGIGRLAGDVVARIERLGSGDPLAGAAVSLVYTRRAAQGGRAPLVSALLPLDRALLQPLRRWPSRALPDFAMAPQALLAALVRSHIFASVFHASAEAMVTENAARLALMQQAEQSVDERLDRLKRQISTVRQDDITSELMDLVIGHVQ